MVDLSGIGIRELVGIFDSPIWSFPADRSFSISGRDHKLILDVTFDAILRKNNLCCI